GRSLACQALQSLFACLFDAFVYLSSFSLSSVFCIWSLSLCFLSHLPYFLSTTTTDFRLYAHRACTHHHTPHTTKRNTHTHTPTQKVYTSSYTHTCDPPTPPPPHPPPTPPPPHT